MPSFSLVEQSPCLLCTRKAVRWLTPPSIKRQGGGWTGFLALRLQLPTPLLLPAAASLLEKPVSSVPLPRWQRACGQGEKVLDKKEQGKLPPPCLAASEAPAAKPASSCPGSDPPALPCPGPEGPLEVCAGLPLILGALGWVPTAHEVPTLG